MFYVDCGVSRHCRTKIPLMPLSASSSRTMSLLPGSLLSVFSARLLLVWPKWAFGCLPSPSSTGIMRRNFSILPLLQSSPTAAGSGPILLSRCTVHFSPLLLIVLSRPLIPLLGRTDVILYGVDFAAMWSQAFGSWFHLISFYMSRCSFVPSNGSC